MKKIEYKIHELKSLEPAQTEHLLDWLNSLGVMGWELCWINVSGPMGGEDPGFRIRGIFKREAE